jgi:GNAT superfamily N-acetyltransferase
MVAAIRDGGLAGYLGGIRLAEFKGKDKGVYCPEWGHSVGYSPGLDRRMVYSAMYEAIGDLWVREARLNHAITIMAHDREALDVWVWNGFGMLAVDVIRGLHPVETAGSSDPAVRVRAATLDDVPRLLPAFQEHELYYNRPPIWLPKAPLAGDGELVADISNPEVKIWMAEDPDGCVLGVLKSQSSKGDACHIVWDEGSVACSGAYVLPDARRRGIGALLLAAAVNWARALGLKRMSLDFEAANIYGRAFWLRHFTPVCYSVLRHVNDKIDVAALAKK